MAVKKDIGFVLRTFDFRSSSVIAHILTKDRGKVHGIFKGFRTGKKHFTTPLNTFSLNEFMFYESRSQLWLFSFADVIDDFSYLKESLNKNFIAQYIVELSNKVLPLNLPSPDIFNLVKNSFSFLKDNQDKKILYIFQVKILELSGFQPHLTACLKCRQEIKYTAFFSMKFGGFLCSDCWKHDRFAKEVSAELISCFRYIQKHDFELALRLNSSAAVEKEIFVILEDFLRYHLDTRLKSLSAIAGIYS
jgi:DNA repair protein RecO (recombination protein O)